MTEPLAVTVETDPLGVTVGVPWDDHGREFLIRLRYKTLPRVVLTEVTLVSKDDGPVPRTALRNLPLGDLEEKYRPKGNALLDHYLDRVRAVTDSEIFNAWDVERMQRHVATLVGTQSQEPPKKRGGRKPLTPEDLEPVAAAYIEAWQQGRKDLWRAVQEAFPNHSEWTLARYIKRAKELGLIPDGVGPNR